MFSLKRKIGHFHVLVVQNSQKKYKKKCHARFANWTYRVFFDVLGAVASLDVKVPTIHTLSHPPQIASGGQSTHWQILKNESRRCIKIFQICQNHDAIIVFLQSKNKKFKKKCKTRNRNTQAKTETHIPEQKHATRKKEHKSRYGKTFPKKETQAKTNLKWKHNKENKIRDTKQKQQPENDM